MLYWPFLVVREEQSFVSGGVGEVAGGWDWYTTPFRHPLDFIGSEGGGGVGAGPGIAVGAALALKGSGRLPIAVCGDGNFFMGVTALWTAVHHLHLRGAHDREIDGGYVVNGWQQYAHPENAPRDAHGKVVVPQVTVSDTLRYQISNRRVPDWKLLETLPYRRWMGRSGLIYVHERLAGDGG